MEEPLTVKQAARFLGLKKGTVYNMISRRAIPYHKLGAEFYSNRPTGSLFFEVRWLRVCLGSQLLDPVEQRK